MNEKPYLFITTHERQEFHVVGVRAQYLDDAISRLLEIPELAGHHVTKAIVATDEVLNALRHVLVSRA
ncbi:hypothetical protein [Paraburkholderia aromaticivorans]|uniref:hypothetical protein n=1 Tax=Paraburkholderia aromaticivorans TaxID=2026199 RepID=UPI0014561140|nr:hypothetical protein [Paraburkholderia aromaticivorans]